MVGSSDSSSIRDDRRRRPILFGIKDRWDREGTILEPLRDRINVRLRSRSSTMIKVLHLFHQLNQLLPLLTALRRLSILDIHYLYLVLGIRLLAVTLDSYRGHSEALITHFGIAFVESTETKVACGRL